MLIVDAVIALILGVYGVTATIASEAHSGIVPPPLASPFAPQMTGSAYAFRGDETKIVSLTVLAALALALRRRFPLGTFLIVLATSVGMHGFAVPRVVLIMCLIGGYSAARYSPYRLAVVASVLLAGALISEYFGSALPDIPSLLTSFVVLIPSTLAADLIRTGKLRAAENRERIRALEREQAESVKRAAEQERARIARELHDVVTHNVSVMVVQAGAARKIMDMAPDQAREALLAVEASGRSAMSELRQVMGLLAPSSDDVALDPQPGLDQVVSLVDRVRATGMPVELTVTGTVRPLPAGIDLAAYRVVQEALTNTMKHAAGASARIAVDYGDALLRITVTDAGGTPAQIVSSGRGLIGLRERLAVYEGSVQTTKQNGGGYQLRAVIPLEGA